MVDVKLKYIKSHENCTWISTDLDTTHVPHAACCRVLRSQVLCQHYPQTNLYNFHIYFWNISFLALYLSTVAAVCLCIMSP